MNLFERIFEVGDRAINIAVGPENGPPLLLFHGVTRRWQTFVPILPSLMGRFEVYVVDFPGHGKSDRSRTGYRVVDYVDLIERLLSTPPFSTKHEFYFYGHSLGSMVAGALAGRFGEKVRAAILEDPPFHTMGERIRQTPLFGYFSAVKSFAGNPDKLTLTGLAKQLADVTFTDPTGKTRFRLGDSRDTAALRFMAKCLVDLDPAVYEPIVASQWLTGFDWQAEFSQIECPILLIQADSKTGGMLIDEDATNAAKLIPDCSAVKFDSIGHLIHWQATDRLLRVVEAFNESVLD